MIKNLLIITVFRSIYYINMVCGKTISRLNFKLSKLASKKEWQLYMRTSDNLRWHISTNSHVECMIAMDALENHIIELIDSLELKNEWVVDMGANCGGLTLRFAKAVGKEGRVIAYEPNSDVAIRLEENLRLNNFTHVTVLRKGVWSSSGSFTLYLPKHNNTGTASLVDKTSNTGGRTVVVPVEPFDERWQALGCPRIRLVKMDIQGAEIHAIDGMAKMLSRCRPVIIIEVTGTSLNYPDKLSTYALSLSQFGYSSAKPITKNIKDSFGIDDIMTGTFDEHTGDFCFV